MGFRLGEYMYSSVILMSGNLLYDCAYVLSCVCSVCVVVCVCVCVV